MRLRPERIEEIECITWDLLNDSYSQKVITPPVDINLVIKKSGLTLKMGNFENPNIDGAYDKSKKEIYIAKTAPYHRQVFTAAHELGHYYLHIDKPIEIYYRMDSENPNTYEETEANWFAASLLMPKPLLNEIWSLTNDVNEIARRFAVSASAAFYRLKSLKLINYENN